MARFELKNKSRNAFFITPVIGSIVAFSIPFILMACNKSLLPLFISDLSSNWLAAIVFLMMCISLVGIPVIFLIMKIKELMEQKKRNTMAPSKIIFDNCEDSPHVEIYFKELKKVIYYNEIEKVELIIHTMYTPDVQSGAIKLGLRLASSAISALISSVAAVSWRATATITSIEIQIYAGKYTKYEINTLGDRWKDPESYDLLRRLRFLAKVINNFQYSIDGPDSDKIRSIMDIEANPYDAVAYMEMARDNITACPKPYNPSKALADINKAIELDTLVEAYKLRAMLYYYTLNNKELALKYVEKILELNPNDTFAQDLQKELKH